jgi:hypothetical protein
MGVEDPAAAGLTRHAEEFEGVGEIVGWVRDLELAWQDELDRGRMLIGAAEAERVYGTTIDAPPPVVWDWVTSPGRRLQWQYGVTGIAEETGVAGRRGVGTVTHCVHGPTAIVEEVLDWRPYDYVTYRSQFPVPGSQPIVDTFAFARRRRRGDAPRAAPREAPARRSSAPCSSRCCRVSTSRSSRGWPRSGGRSRPTWRHARRHRRSQCRSRRSRERGPQRSRARRADGLIVSIRRARRSSLG